MTGQEITERAHRAAENVWFILMGRAAVIAVSIMLVPVTFGLITWLNTIEKRQNDHGERMAIVESVVKEDHGTLIESSRDRLTFQTDIARRVRGKGYVAQEEARAEARAVSQDDETPPLPF